MAGYSATGIVLAALAAQAVESTGWDLPREPAAQEEIVLTRSRDQPPRPSLRRAASMATETPMLPIGDNIAPLAAVQAFGAERRCAADGSRLVCAGGSQPAGALLQFTGRRFPKAARLAVEVEVLGDPQGFAAEMVKPGADAAQPAALQTGWNRLALPDHAHALTLVAPRGAAQVTLGAIRLVPAAPVGEAATRAAWSWEPQRWRDQGADLLDQAASQRLNRLYIGLHVDQAGVADAATLAAFVASARARGVAVFAVEGDPAMTSGEGLRHARTRAAAIAAYQRGRPPEQRLAGVQYDIEPYVAAAWTDDADAYRAWTAAIVALGREVGAPIDLVVPFWLPEQAEGRRLLRAARGAISGITVMAYRTSAERLVVAAEPVLAWGAAHRMPVVIALEAGALVDEVSEIYTPASEGELAVMPGAPPRLQKLSAPGRIAGARMYRLAQVEVARADRISFLGDEARMARLAGDAAPTFAAWSSFAGYAFHGLGWK